MAAPARDRVQPGVEAAMAAAWGAATWLVAAFAAREGALAWVPSPTDASTAVRLGTLAALALVLALLYEAFRRLLPGRPSHDGLTYATAFTATHGVLDSWFLFRTFAGGRLLFTLPDPALRSVAAFLPLAYVAFLAVPVLCERRRGRELTGST
jgi:hypothetical protein